MNKPTMNIELMTIHNEMDSLTKTMMDMELDSLKADYIDKHGDLLETSARLYNSPSIEAIEYRHKRDEITSKYNDMLFNSWLTHDIV